VWQWSNGAEFGQDGPPVGVVVWHNLLVDGVLLYIFLPDSAANN
jgi:hypothetical protein